MKRRRFLKIAGLLGLGGAAADATYITAARAQNSYYKGPSSDHFDGLHFFNPGGHKPKGFVELMKWQLGGGRKKWPAEYPSPHSYIPEERVKSGELRVTFVGHASVLIQTNGVNILTDPVWSDRASPFQWAGPKRVNPPGIPFDKLPPIDVVLLSHNHYDHLDLDTLQRLHQKFAPVIYTPLGNDTILKAHNPDFQIVVGDWGDTFQSGRELWVNFEPTHHWSARGITDRRNALWSAFVLVTSDHEIYHVGDTGFHDGINYREVAKKYTEIDLAILPFGAYEPRDFMRQQHQNPDEAVQGHKLCGARYTLGHHWGTFQLTNESIEDQLNDLEAARTKHGVAAEDFRALQPGETWLLPEMGS